MDIGKLSKEVFVLSEEQTRQIEAMTRAVRINLAFAFQEGMVFETDTTPRLELDVWAEGSSNLTHKFSMQIKLP